MRSHDWRSAVGAGLLVVFGGLIGVALSEGAYRAYLYLRDPGRFRPPHGPRDFSVLNASEWEFDEQFGYVYPSGRVIDRTVIRDGYVDHCRRFRVINRYGNIGGWAGVGQLYTWFVCQ